MIQPRCSYEYVEADPVGDPGGSASIAMLLSLGPDMRACFLVGDPTLRLVGLVAMYSFSICWLKRSNLELRWEMVTKGLSGPDILA